jgi:hypothetical protein
MSDRLQARDSVITAVVAAISERSASAVLQLVTPSIDVLVRAGGEVEETRNQHLWRQRAVSGRTELESYLAELFATLPALDFQLEVVEEEERRVTLAAEAAGVDSLGSPFTAAGQARIEFSAGQLVRAFTCDITQLDIGDHVIREGSDPERFFRPFLDAARPVSS